MTQAVTENVDQPGTKYGLYKRVEHDLRRRVTEGEWKEGALLPRRRDLAREYRIDVNTLQRAILPLVADGTLKAEGKRGTFVSDGSEPVVIPDRVATPLQVRDASGEDVWSGVNSARASSTSLKNKTLGIIVYIVTGQVLGSDTGAIHTRDIVRAIEASCANAGGQARLFNTYLAGGVGCRVIDAARVLLAERVDALLVLDIYDNPAIGVELCSMPSSKEVPLVYVSSVGNFVPHLHVFYDQRHAGYLAATHLLERNWTDITFLAPYRANWVEDRITGARLAVERSGIEGATFQVVPLNPKGEQYDSEEADVKKSAIHDACMRGQIRGGVITANDDIARLVINEATEAGLTIGVDYAVLGFDDDVESASMGLTSVRPPLEDMGAVAVNLLSGRIAGGSANMHVSLRSQLVVRASTSQNPRLS